MSFAEHADALVRLVRAAVGVVDEHGNLHAPKGLGELSGRFVAKLDAGAFDGRAASAAQMSEAVDAARIEPTDREVRQAIQDYSGGGSYAANDALRRAGGHVDQVTDWRARGVIQGMDRALEGAELDRDVVVVRGVTDLALTFGGREPVAGMEWVDHGYVSTSAQFSASDMFTGVEYGITGGAEMRILVPRGTRAISSNLLPYDSEIVLDRGLTFRVVRDNGVNFDGVRQLDVEIVGSRGAAD